MNLKNSKLKKNRKDVVKLAGYCGWSMSNNAVEAYESGIMPLSKWTKEKVLNAIEDSEYDSSFFAKWNTAELKTLLYYSEWHHTSSAFNRTDFYALDTEAVEEYLNGKEKPVIKTERKQVLLEEGFWHGKCKCSEFHPAARRNKYRVWYEDFENARKKGDWIILQNGDRKKFSNCIDVVHTKNKRRKKIKT